MALVLERAAPETLAGRAFRGRAWRGFSPSRILCVGKAAGGLAAASAGRWPGVPGLVYASSAEASAPAGFEVLAGDHPFPSAANLANTARVRRWLEEGWGPLLACVSGGTSALLVEPRPPWTLEEKLSVTGRLWGSGATIRELNSVRAALSSVKAGGLLESAAGSRVRTAVWSDVGPRDGILVGSAPTIPWNPTPPPASVAARYGIRLPRPLPAHRRVARGRSEWTVLFDGIALRRACAARLRARGYRVVELAFAEGEDAEALAVRLADAWVRGAGRLPAAIVGSSEASVTLPPSAGRGGRCSHLAAAVALALARARKVRPWAFAALATDGIDGTAGGGARVDSLTCPPAGKLSEALRRFDTASLWEAWGGLLPAVPTGNNLRDFWVLADAGGGR